MTTMADTLDQLAQILADRSDTITHDEACQVNVRAARLYHVAIAVTQAAAQRSVDPH